MNVTQAPEVIGGEVDLAAGCLGPGEIVLLENTRFEPGETKNDPMLAGSLAPLARSTSTTPSGRRTGRTPRPRAWRATCPATRGCCWSAR